MKQPNLAVRSALFGLAGALLIAAPGHADAVADFYRGKTVSILMGTGPGGSYDLYGRTFAEHMGRHIPGNPNFIVEHMPGAGGANAGNHIYGAAPQDGSRILLSHALPLVEKMRGGEGIRFESAKFQWLGCFDEIAQVLALWHTAPAKTLEDLRKADVVIGSFNRTHLTYQWGTLVKNTLGAEFRVITGYGSGALLNQAMEQGEIHGWPAAWANLVGTKPDWLRDRHVNILMQFGLKRHPDLLEVPTLLEIAPPEMKDVVEFLGAGLPIARAMAVGPQVPPDRVAALRAAFAATVRDPAFLADAQSRKLDINPRTADETHALVDTIVNASPALVERVKKATGQLE